MHTRMQNLPRGRYVPPESKIRSLTSKNYFWTRPLVYSSLFRISGFGLLSAFGFRPSDFGAAGPAPSTLIGRSRGPAP